MSFSSLAPSSSPAARPLPASQLTSSSGTGSVSWNDNNQVKPPTQSTSNTDSTPTNTAVATSTIFSQTTEVIDSGFTNAYYPSWTGEIRGCLNDGNMPQLMLDNPSFFIFETEEVCCEKNFQWDPNQNSCFQGQSVSLDTPTNSPVTSPTASLSTTESIVDKTLSSSSLPSSSITQSPTSQPTSTTMPTAPKFLCPEGITNSKFCIQTAGAAKTYQKKEYVIVSIIWGMRYEDKSHGLWKIKEYSKARTNQARSSSNIHPADLQNELIDIVNLARNAFGIHPQLTWIEALHDFAVETGLGFPVKKDIFIGVVENLKARSSFFRKLVEREIATSNPGISGDDHYYTSVSLLSEVQLASKADASELALKEWTNFTNFINSDMVPEAALSVQSDAFLDSLRTTAIVDSTASSYFFANGLFLVVILLFTGNLLLTLMVMISLILVLICVAGVIFAIYDINFGPVESLGVSIFVGLSSNYLLHIAHAYHTSNIKERSVKIQRAVFLVGSPILWSALSTIGGSAFLFACRTWLLTELGLLICRFLLAFLSITGPLPLANINLHTCDLLSIFYYLPCLRKYVWKGNVEDEKEPMIIDVVADGSFEENGQPQSEIVVQEESHEANEGLDV